MSSVYLTHVCVAGISDIDQLMAAFAEGEDKNYSLFNYVNGVSCCFSCNAPADCATGIVSWGRQGICMTLACTCLRSTKKWSDWKIRSAVFVQKWKWLPSR